MNHIEQLDIESRKAKKKIKIDRSLLIKYNHLAEIEYNESVIDVNDEIEVEYFELFDKVTGQEINIFDLKQCDDQDQRKLDTLFYMVYKYRIQDFRFRIARHELELSFGDEITYREDKYITEATKLLTDLLKLIRMRDTNFKNVTVIFKVNDLANPSSDKKLSNEDKRVEFKDDIYSKYIIQSSIGNILGFLAQINNFYIDPLFYFCRNADLITTQEVESELNKIPQKSKTRKKGNEVSNLRIYMGFLIELTQRFIYDEELLFNGKKLNVNLLRLVSFQLLAVFGFIPLEVINRLYQKTSSKLSITKTTDYIRKITSSAVTEKGKIEIIEVWNTIKFLQNKPPISTIEDRYPKFLVKFNEYSELIGSDLRIHEIEGEVRIK